MHSGNFPMMLASNGRLLRFGIMVSGAELQHWQHQCLTTLSREFGVAAAAVIVAESISDSNETGRFGTAFYRKSVKRRDTLTISSPLPAEFSKLPRIHMPASAVSAPDARSRFKREIAGLDLDFVLSFSSRVHAVEITESVRLGVWEYQFGSSGEPAEHAGFWEVYDDANLSSGRLLRVLRDPRNVTVLREGHLRTRRTSIAANRTQLLERFLNWPALVCRDIRNNAAEYLNRTSRVDEARRRAPLSNSQMAIFCTCVGWRSLVRSAKKFFRHDQWNVGIIHQPIWTLLSDRAYRVEWLPGPPDAEFIADPFGIMNQGHLTIVCEHLKYTTGKGTIAAAKMGATAYQPMSLGPIPPVHMSYPFLIQQEGQLFCIPETHEAGEIALYVAESFPDKWRRIGVLVANTETVDATPFQYEGRWWIAGSEPALDGASAELRLWHADDLKGPWIEHAANPVKIDVRSSRPAGTPFVHEGALYRPAQDCSQSYGGRTVINKVLALTPTVYLEEVVAVVEPDATGPFPSGLHTISAVGELTLIDGRRWVFSADEALRCLVGAFSRRKGRGSRTNASRS